ncbi:cell division cycle protein 45 [Arctopsyche grandis]|uniref:cell division cycle protein 45 n=1 Tax=Arctopsyche grandis TaxID=121162 RepID=UPI00406D6382
MLVREPRHDFYEKLPGHRILLLVNYDLDAICACKILQSLFKCDNIPYTLVPVKGVLDLKTAFDENSEEIKYVVLVNCGGTIDIIDLLQPDDSVIFFIIDSHKPTDVCNIYSDGQVRVLWGDSDENVPNFDDIFKDDDDNSDAEVDQDDGDHSSEEESARETRMERLQRTTEESLRKRREKRAWEENRNKLMFDYTQFSFYSRSSAVIMFELAWKLSKDNNDLLWWAIVGITEQVLLEKIEHSQYILETGTLQSHVTRLAYNNQDHQQAPTSTKIWFDKDVRLALYRHWSVESSLRYSTYTASKLRLWTLSGEKKLFQLLVDMGLPLVQARQTFTSMDLVLRKEFLPSLERLGEKYSLPDIVFASFNLKHGYRNKFCASDVVYALLAILEHGVDSSSDSNQNFQTALDALSRCHGEILKKGIEIAKKILINGGRQIQASMENHAIVNMGPFLCLTLQSSAGDRWVFGEPHWLGILARWALRSSRSRTSLPLLMAVSLPSGVSVLLGVPPVADDSTRNLFGKAFEQAAIRSNLTVSLDYFDTSIMVLQTEDINKFLDALTSLLG